MIIQRSAAYLALPASSAAYFRQNRQADSGEPATTSDKVTISQAGHDRLSASPASSADSMSTIDTANRYQVSGAIISVKELVEKKPELRVEDGGRLKEHMRWEAQMQAREELIRKYAQQHPSEIYGQVMVDGKPFATVWDDGVMETPGPMPGLKTTDDGDRLEIAKARLREIAQAVHGEIIYKDFVGPATQEKRWTSHIPESFLATLPPITARPFGEQ